MPFSTQTLDGIPREFLIHQNMRAAGSSNEPRAAHNAEDLLFILAILIFLQDEPFFSTI